MCNPDSTQIQNDILNIKGDVDIVKSKVKFILNNDPYIMIQRRLAVYSEKIYNTILDANLKSELLEYSNKCQNALLLDEIDDFGKYSFLQIESLIKYGLFTKIGITKINTDLQDSSITVTKKINETHVTKTLVDDIFGWRKDNEFITAIASKTIISEKDIRFTEKTNLFFYYYFILNNISSFPDYKLTDVIKLVRDRSSHGQSKVIDSKNLIPAFENDFREDYYQLCHRVYLHISKFVKALI